MQMRCQTFLLAGVLLIAGTRAADDTADWVPISQIVDLPKPPFSSMKVREPKRKLVRPFNPDLRVPRNVANVALKKKVSTSDPAPKGALLSAITDGEKDIVTDDINYVELAPGRHWVQVDLGAEYAIYAIAVWHRSIGNLAHVYHDVVVQIADDADFTVNVQTLFSNDDDNSMGLGVGSGDEYIEDYLPLIAEGNGAKARYVRCWSSGNTMTSTGRENQFGAGSYYREIEVWALPAK